MYYVSNQSLRGVLARLDPPPTLWLTAVALVVAYWCWWVRSRKPDTVLGFAVTGVIACLVSPITWVHHLVWLIPGVFLLLDRAVRMPEAEPRRRRLALLGGGFVIMSSSLVWIWWAHPLGWGAFPGSNAYVWLSLVVLAALTQESWRPAPILAHGIRAEADRS